MKAREVKRIRKQAGLSQSGFAELIGVPVRTLQEWEQGRAEPRAAAVSLLKLVAEGKIKPSRR